MISSRRVSRHVTFSTDKYEKFQSSPLMATTGTLSRAIEALVTRYLEKPNDFLVKGATSD